jgi:hypothetical protein
MGEVVRSMRNTKLASGALVLLALPFTVGCQSEADKKMDAIQAVAVAKWNATPHATVVTPEMLAVQNMASPGTTKAGRKCRAALKAKNYDQMQQLFHALGYDEQFAAMSVSMNDARQNPYKVAIEPTSKLLPSVWLSKMSVIAAVLFQFTIALNS